MWNKALRLKKFNPQPFLLSVSPHFSLDWSLPTQSLLASSSEFIFHKHSKYKNSAQIIQKWQHLWLLNPMFMTLKAYGLYHTSRLIDTLGHVNCSLILSTCWPTFVSGNLGVVVLLLCCKRCFVYWWIWLWRCANRLQYFCRPFLNYTIKEKLFRVNMALETNKCRILPCQRVWNACRYFLSVYSSWCHFPISCSAALDFFHTAPNFWFVFKMWS